MPAFGLLGKLRELAEGSLPRFDLHAVFTDDEHGVALMIGTVSRGGRSLTWNGAHVFHLRDDQVVEFWDAFTDQYAYDEFLG